MRFFFVDLYAGLGGASSAMVESDRWVVIQIDNNPDLIEYNPGLLMCDVRDTTATIALITEALELANFRHGIDVLIVWSSPPCLEFSHGYYAPGPVAAREGRPFTPSMVDVEATTEIVQHFCPTWHIIENVRGACKHFRPVLGDHAARAGSFFFWGSFPSLCFDDTAREHMKSDVDPGNHPLRSNFRAKVPLSVSTAFKEAIESTTTLQRWITDAS